MNLPPPDARQLVDTILEEAVRRRASDIHVEPTENGYEIRLRVDGLLETMGLSAESVSALRVTLCSGDEVGP